MNHTVKITPLTKSEDCLLLLHNVDNSTAGNWPETVPTGC